MTYLDFGLEAVAITGLLALLIYNRRFREQFFVLLLRFSWLLAVGAIIWLLVAAIFGVQATMSAAPSLIPIGLMALNGLIMAATFVYFQFFAMARPQLEIILPSDAGKKDTILEHWIGSELVIEMAREWVQALNNPGLFLGDLPTGAMLVGPPGGGKTLLARAIAGETNLPVVLLTASSLNGPFMGMGGMLVKALLKTLLKLAAKFFGVIVFIDEIDVIIPQRTGLVGKATTSGNSDGGLGMGGNGALHSLLAAMSGAESGEPWWRRTLTRWGAPLKPFKRGHIFWLAATNKQLSELDPAARRRFKEEVLILDPTTDHRSQMFALYLKNRSVAPDVLTRLDYLGQVSNGLNGAAINEVCRMSSRRAKNRALVNRQKANTGRDFLAVKGAMLLSTALPDPKATRSRMPMHRRLARLCGFGAEVSQAQEVVVFSPDEVQITLKDLCQQIWISMFGLPSPTPLAPRSREKVADHEGGHALVALVDPVTGVVVLGATIRPGADFLGMVLSGEIGDSIIGKNEEDLYRRMLMCLASLAVEQEITRERSDGGGSDLEQASKIALSIAGQLGLGERLLSVKATGNKYSQQQIDEANLIMAATFAFAREYVLHYRPVVEAISAKLQLETDVIGPDLEVLVRDTIKANNIEPYASIMAEIKQIKGSLKQAAKKEKLADLATFLAERGLVSLLPLPALPAPNAAPRD